MDIYSYKHEQIEIDQKKDELGLFSVVFWLVNTSSCNNKTNHDMWGK